MLRRALKRATLGRRAPARSSLPYEMFDQVATAKQVEQARKLEKIYHRGQEKIWDGKAILDNLVKKHGGVHLSPEKTRAVHQIFGMILWGELAAWKVSAALADALQPMEAKLAATSQAHDEARHFYVMHDYLQLSNYRAEHLPHAAQRTLEEVINANTLAKKLIGMQLMIEPVALTLFQTSRERKIEPILTELLPYYERDEARHVALGINYLPELLKGASRAEMADLVLWQLRMFDYEVRGMKSLENAFRTLGFNPREVLRLGMAKQLIAFRAMTKEMGEHPAWLDAFKKFFDFRIEVGYPEDRSSPLPVRLWEAARRTLEGIQETQTSLLTVPETP